MLYFGLYMTLRNNSNSSGLTVSERLRAKFGEDLTRGVISKMVWKWTDSHSKKYLWTSNGLHDNIEVSSREVILRVIADGLE